ncbi:uncharacterized protein TNCV_528571 [Trichonephila clavipes]|nr:uncharacterized protein TNCV_528571 [Trichonephila clavipes]
MVSVQHLLDQCRHRTTIVFGNLGRWPDRVTYYESEYPYTLFFEPNFGVYVTRSFGKTVIVFTSDKGDLTWDKGVDLKFFRVGRPPSCQVWEAYQPQNTEAYPSDLTHCTRLADLYVTWLTLLADGGNASRREPTLACSVSPTMETGFGNTCGTLASERFRPWDAL